MNTLKCILITAFLFFSGTGGAQNFQSRNFTMKDGMPSNSVRAIFKDSEGYLWIGTDGGLCRFDGKQFRIFGQSDGFTGNRIWAIAEDNSGNMWFGDYGNGLYRYDGREFLHISEKDSLVNNYVRKLYYSQKWNLLLIGTQDGLTVYDGNRFINFEKEAVNEKIDLFITDFIENQNEILVLTFSFLNCTYKPANATLSPVDTNLGYYWGGYQSGFQTSEGKTLLTLRNRLEIWQDKRFIKRIIKPANSEEGKSIGEIFDICEDLNDNIWLASWTPDASKPGGLFLYDGERVWRKNHILDKDPIRGWSLFYDQQDNIMWFGSLDMGLFMIRETLFEYFPPAQFGMETMYINDIEFDREGNLILLDRRNLVLPAKEGSYTKVANDKFYKAYKEYFLRNGDKKIKFEDRESFMEVLDYKKMAFQNDSLLWINSRAGLFRLNLQNHQIKCFRSGGYGANEIYFDELGRLCKVNYWGGYQILEDIEQGVKRLYGKNSPHQPKNLTGIVFHNQEVWMTSWSHGLYRGKDTLFTNYNTSNSPVSNSLNAICSGNDGNLFIGANNGKLYCAKPDKDSLNIFKILDASDGVLGNSILWLKVDFNDHLWVGTSTGLNRINLPLLLGQDSLIINQYDGKEGYLHPNVNISLVDKAGNIWLGTDESLVCLHIPEKESSVHHVRRIKITDFEVNDESRPFTGNYSDRPESMSVGLDHHQNYLKFDFDVINYINPEKDRFRFYLEGLDNEWSKFNKERYASYPYLPPGEYLFRVEGRNLNTGEQYIPLTLAVTIHAPFWETWWFYSLALAGLVFLTVIFFRYRINKAHREAQMKAEISKQLAGLEMKALLAQMNPHFTFNAINSIQNYILDNEVDAALTYLSDFSKIIRQTLENATKEFITLENEIDYIERYLRLEQMRFDRQFSYQIITDEQPDPETTMIPPMIIQPYLENAIKHGLRHKKGEGRLSVVFQIADDKKLLCIIEDNGIGRSASAAINQQIQKDHNSSGMTITKNRIDALRKMYKSDMFTVQVIDLFSQDKHPAGTRVKIVLPLSRPI